MKVIKTYLKLDGCNLFIKCPDRLLYGHLVIPIRFL